MRQPVVGPDLPNLRLLKSYLLKTKKFCVQIRQIWIWSKTYQISPSSVSPSGASPLKKILISTAKWKTWFNNRWFSLHLLWERINHPINWIYRISHSKSSHPMHWIAMSLLTYAVTGSLHSQRQATEAFGIYILQDCCREDILKLWTFLTALGDLT